MFVILDLIIIPASVYEFAFSTTDNPLSVETDLNALNTISVFVTSNYSERL